MKKILSGFLGLFAVIGLVAGVGYALFTTSANLNGMVLGTATPGLLVSLDDSDYKGALNLYNLGVHFAPLLPGTYDWGHFYLKNSSNPLAPDHTDRLDLNLDLQAQITAAGGDWGTLYNVIQAKICIFDDTKADKCSTNVGEFTNYMTLATWNAAPRDLPGGPLAEGAIKHYALVFNIPDSTIGNGFAGKTITGMNIVITGTEHL